ncbi:MAG TPA: DUF2231 domain-containing protein, partial [Ktedonobacterales bacterium]|nr:DUF2231 domain-containing protein [Ktedonobacterales bacterium]
MYSRLKIFGHPIHPMLVAHPIALYTSTLVAYLIYVVGHDTFWFNVAVVVNIGAIIMAAVTALPGFLDWAIGIPNASPAKAHGLNHMLLNVAALISSSSTRSSTPGSFSRQHLRAAGGSCSRWSGLAAP